MTYYKKTSSILGILTFFTLVSSSCAVNQPNLPQEPAPVPASGSAKTQTSDVGVDVKSTDKDSDGFVSPALEITDAGATVYVAQATGADGETDGSDDSEIAEDVADILSSSDELAPLSGWQHRVRGIELISKGDWDLAKRHLEQAANLERNPNMALAILEQLSVDPIAYLGEEFFYHTVNPGDTLSLIAERFLGDSMKFPILARYNGVEVPIALEKGMIIKIPQNSGLSIQNTAPIAEPTGSEPEVTPAIVNPTTATDATTEVVATEADEKSEDVTPEMRQSTKALFSQADFFYQKGQFEQAQGVIGQLLEIDPNNIRARMMRKRLRDKVE